PPNGEAVVLPAVHVVRLLRGDLVGDRDRHFLEWAEALLCELVRDGFVWVWAVAWPGATCFRLGRARHQCQSGHCAGSRQGDSSCCGLHIVGAQVKPAPPPSGGTCLCGRRWWSALD